MCSAYAIPQLFEFSDFLKAYVVIENVDEIRVSRGVFMHLKKCPPYQNPTNIFGLDREVK